MKGAVAPSGAPWSQAERGAARSGRAAQERRGEGRWGALGHRLEGWGEHPLIVEDAPWLCMVHDRNARAMSLKVRGIIDPQRWYNASVETIVV